jgi:hypothetical protein
MLPRKNFSVLRNAFEGQAECHAGQEKFRNGIRGYNEIA